MNQRFAWYEGNCSVGDEYLLDFDIPVSPITYTQLSDRCEVEFLPEMPVPIDVRARWISGEWDSGWSNTVTYVPDIGLTLSIVIGVLSLKGMQLWQKIRR